MLQDLFIKAMRQGDASAPSTNARAWLFEVARNALADRLRLARKTVELPEDLASQAEEARPSTAWPRACHACSPS